MKKITDERIERLNNKIQSEAYILVICLLALSVFVKSYIFDMKFSSYRTELIVILLSILYVSIRTALIGSQASGYSGNVKRLIFPIAIGGGVLITVVNGIRNYSLYGNKYQGVTDRYFLAVLGFTFVSATLFIAIIASFLYLIDEYGQKRLEKKLDDSEHEE